MKAGYQGTFVISWAQTELDGAVGAPVADVRVGACWRWWGQAVRVDGPNDYLILQNAKGEAALRARAARMVGRLMGMAVQGGQPDAAPEDDAGIPEQSFSVTDGFRIYVVSLIELPDVAARLLMFVGAIPPSDCDLWVVDRTLDPRPRQLRLPEPGVICFTPGTMIATPEGPRPVEALRPGARVATRDDGPQEVLWMGQRRMSGARLYTLPHLRPIRIRAGAFGLDEPERDLLVSPQHRMLVRGPAAQALFNESEVLVQASDLINGRSVRVEPGLPEVHYIHLLLERHQVIWANGLATESFHPASTALELIAEDQRAGLLEILPGVAEDPLSYGAYARRALSAPEATILRHDLAA